MWSTDTQTGALAGPGTYEVDGEQYVAVVAGWRQTGSYWAPNNSRILVYKLGGTAKLPEVVPFPAPELNPPAAFGSPEVVAHGEEVYGRFCSTCHGRDGASSAMFPDLRYAGAIQNADAFKTIVLDGALSQNGMVSFAKALKPEDAEAVRAFVVSRAIEAKKTAPPAAAPAAAKAPAGPHG